MTEVYLVLIAYPPLILKILQCHLHIIRQKSQFLVDTQLNISNGLLNRLKLQKYKGDKCSQCLTPVIQENKFDCLSLSRTQDLILSYIL